MLTRTQPSCALARTTLLTLCAGAALSPSAHAERGLTARSSYWTDPVSGNWFDPDRWTHVVPQNTDDDIYFATIDAVGSPYTVTVDDHVTIHQINLLSGDATLRLTDGAVFRTTWGVIGNHNTIGAARVHLQNATIDGGTWHLDDSAEVRVTGYGLNTIRNATFLGDVLVNSGVTLRFENSHADCLRLLGNGSGLSSTGDLSINSEVIFEGSGTGSRDLETESPVGRVVLGQDARLTTSDDFQGKVRIGSDNYSSSQSVTNNGSINLRGGTATISGGAVTNNNAIDVGDAALTIASDIITNAGLMTFSGADVLTQAGTLVNAGAITANLSSLDLSSGLVNVGTVFATNTLVTIDAQRFSSPGAMSLAFSTLRVGGEFTLGQLSDVQRVGSIIEIAGTLNNQGQTLELSTLNDTLRLGGGTVRGGTIVGDDPSALTFGANAVNTFDDVQYDGRVDILEERSLLRLTNGASVHGHVYLGGQFAELRFDGSVTLTNTVIEGSGADAAITTNADGATLIIGENSAIIGRDISMGSNLTGAGEWRPFATIINRGLISSEGLHEESSLYSSLAPVHVTNEGSIVVRDRGGLVLPRDFENSAGSMTIEQNAWVVFIGGIDGRPPVTLDVLSGDIQNSGNIEFYGRVDLQGESHTLTANLGRVFIGAAYAPSFNDYRLENGVITIEDGAYLGVQGRETSVRDVTIHGALHLHQRSMTSLQNSTIDAVLMERDAVLALDEASAITDTLTLRDESVVHASSFDAVGAISIARGANNEIRFSNLSPGVLDGDAAVEVADNARVLVVGPNNGAATPLANWRDWTLGRGSLATLSAPLVNNDAAITLDTLSRLVIDGDFQQSASGSFVVAVGDDFNEARIQINGAAALAGSLTIAANDPDLLAIGEVIALLRAETGFIGAFDDLTIDQPSLDSDVRLLLRSESDGDADMLTAFVRHVADVSGDGVVDFNDLNAVTSGFGMSGAFLPGDANTDGVVDFIDLNLVLSNFGHTFPRTVPSAPTSLALGIGIVAAARRRRAP
jgi:hypothetical protein